METKDIKKVILTYPGGLDTSIIIPRLKGSYNNCEVVAVSADVKRGTELDELEEKAIETGASELYVLDLKDEFVGDCIYPCLKANAIYEDVYLLGTAFARPLIRQELMEVARQEGADAICYSCTGKENDQACFELTIKAFTPDMPTIAPWRTWELKSRDGGIDYTETRNIPLKISRETNYSRNKNLWHLGYEGLGLEDPMSELQYDDILEMEVTPEQAPDTLTYITLTFEGGVPTALDGEELGGQAMVTRLNETGGANGIDIIDMVENRLVGMKSRGAYKTPGGTILYKARQWLESICLDRETMHYKQGVEIKFSEILYNGQWFAPLREASSAFVDKAGETVGGEVRIKLYKGNLIPASTSSPYTLCSEQITSSDENDFYGQNGSTDFINLYGLSIKVKAIVDEKRRK